MNASQAFCCTGLYVGRLCSADGSVIIARCNDFTPPVVMPYLKVNPSVSGVAGRQVKGINGFSWTLPKDTYKYVSVPYPDVSDYGLFSSAVSNERGLAITATITGYYSQEAARCDPDVSDGVAEETIPDILIASCATAREAVELLARIVDEKGSSEQNIVLLADQKEAWYMEIYSGHQYCAIRLPEDMVCVFGNEFMLDTVDEDKDGVICSKSLFSLPKKNAFAVYESDGRMNLRKTYQGNGRMYDFSHLRTWRGHALLAPSTIGDYERDTYYPLLFKPDMTVSLEKVMSLFRDRYEGTPFNPETSGRDDVRVIGDESQEEVHIMEVFRDVPEEMAVVTWLCLSEAAYAPFVPVSNAITECTPAYGFKAASFAHHKECAQIVFKGLNALASQQRQLWGKGVRAYWERQESFARKEYPLLLERAAGLYRSNPTEALGMLTEGCNRYQSEALEDASRIFDELLYHVMTWNATMAYDCDFENLSLIKMTPPAFDPKVDVSREASRMGWTFRVNAQNKDGSRSLLLSRPADTSKDLKWVLMESSNGHREDTGAISAFSFRDASPDSVMGSDAEESARRKADVQWMDGKMLLPLSEAPVLGLVSE